MKHLTVAVIILMLGIGACKKSETVKNKTLENIGN